MSQRSRHRYTLAPWRCGLLQPPVRRRFVAESRRGTVPHCSVSAAMVVEVVQLAGWEVREALGELWLLDRSSLR